MRYVESFFQEGSFFEDAEVGIIITPQDIMTLQATLKAAVETGGDFGSMDRKISLHKDLQKILSEHNFAIEEEIKSDRDREEKGEIIDEIQKGVDVEDLLSDLPDFDRIGESGDDFAQEREEESGLTGEDTPKDSIGE